MYNPYQQNPYNPYLGQMNPYSWSMQPSVSPPPQYQPIQNQKPQMSQTELSPQNRPVQVQALNLAQSQANQNQYLINTLRPCPVPAYISCNPWANQAAYGSCGTAYGYGCGTCC